MKFKKIADTSFNKEASSFLNTGVTCNSLRLFGKLFCDYFSYFRCYFMVVYKYQTLLLNVLVRYYYHSFYCFFRYIANISVREIKVLAYRYLCTPKSTKIVLGYVFFIHAILEWLFF